MMRQLLFSSLWISTSLFAQNNGSPMVMQGSDTLATYMSEIIAVSGLEADVVYAGGGSSLGETALLSQQQHLAPKASFSVKIAPDPCEGTLFFLDNFAGPRATNKSA
ncbi:hypothetical protein [Oligoflexus tunisiensis]|uniref:hypothetical protein n=1 Tax=Oligoflexus tunisiensis TaxID=708132 RepID=UPI00114C916F|nr:hypothetical protein [Oligoflexus tunisiensis]